MFFFITSSHVTIIQFPFAQAKLRSNTSMIGWVVNRLTHFIFSPALNEGFYIFCVFKIFFWYGFNSYITPIQSDG